VEVRRARLTHERELPEPDADRLLASQLPTEHKRERSDIVIDNDGSLAALETRARDAWKTILQRVTQPRSASA
jgi:dephospho-CoA kinase